MLRRKKLRIEMEDFRRELLGQEGKRIGRFDARFCADHQYVIGTGAFDPATDDAATAESTARICPASISTWRPTSATAPTCLTGR